MVQRILAVLTDPVDVKLTESFFNKSKNSYFWMDLTMRVESGNGISTKFTFNL